MNESMNWHQLFESIGERTNGQTTMIQWMYLNEWL